MGKLPGAIRVAYQVELQSFILAQQLGDLLERRFGFRLDVSFVRVEVDPVHSSVPGGVDITQPVPFESEAERS